MKVNLKNINKIKISNSTDIFQIMSTVLKRENKIDQVKEHFWTVGLAIDNVLLFIELISLGSKDATIVSPSEVFGFALHKGAASIILVHNHPSGNLTPTENDKALTDRLIVTGTIVNCPVIDHLIITENDFFSFEKIGLLKELEIKSKIMPSFIKEIEIAKKMKNKGYSITEISEIIGLPPSEIKILTSEKIKHNNI